MQYYKYNPAYFKSRPQELRLQAQKSFHSPKEKHVERCSDTEQQNLNENRDAQ